MSRCWWSVAAEQAVADTVEEEQVVDWSTMLRMRSPHKAILLLLAMVGSPRRQIRTLKALEAMVGTVCVALLRRSVVVVVEV